MAEEILKQEIAALQRQVQSLNAQLQASKLKEKKGREKIDVMSAEVVDSNPYR